MSFKAPSYSELREMSREQLMNAFTELAQGGLTIRSQLYLNEIHQRESEGLTQEMLRLSRDSEMIARKILRLTRLNALLVAASTVFVILAAFGIV